MCDFRPRRSCDRCHALKERCFWQQDKSTAAAQAAGCARCSRLGFECVVKRPSKRPGRPRLSAKPIWVTALTNNFADDSSMSKQNGKDPKCLIVHSDSVVFCNFSHLDDLTFSEKQLVQNLLFSDAILDRFLIGSSFWEQHRKLLISHFTFSQHILKDAFLAVALACKQHSATELPKSDFTEAYKYASSALEQLRKYPIPSKQHISECLALGAIIITFTYYCSTEPNAMPTCNRTLGLVKEIYESSNDLSEDDLVFMSCLILPELPSCMMRGSLPTLRFRCLPKSSHHVDRYAGLSYPLLPHFYDICRLNNALSHASPEDRHGILEAVNQVEQRVAGWQPQIPPGFINKFSATEVSRMLCQTQVMKMGAMLLIYRLRHPFGTNTEPALVMATTILTQLDLTQAATGTSNSYCLLPLIAACFEIKNQAQRQFWLPEIPRLGGFSSGLSHHVQGLIWTVWKAIDDVKAMNWYDIENILSFYR
ncbi:hypothetical protein FDECE_2560 [Fusarium decemcellulare]|nr:hypothetical protein FDECE_2560 [Fusarium decemcellulare]